MDHIKAIANESIRKLIDHIYIEKGAGKKIGEYLKENNYQKVHIVADSTTFSAAGSEIKRRLTDLGMLTPTTLIKENSQGDVVADEASVVQLLVDTERNVDVFLAVGSGTIHDIVRFVSNKMNIPFISVPTAASVDGFTSAGAPLILRGMKTTIQVSSPVAVFADLEVLTRAPRALTAAGFGDMLAKYTSLTDWKVSELLALEPYDPQIADITSKALETCIQHMDEIAALTESGLQCLMTSLIESGLAMLIADHSRSASGAEHHLSHYWEMNFLQTGKRQVLHGAKVGITTALISDFYHHLAGLELTEGGILLDGMSVPKERLDEQKWNRLQESWPVIRKEVEKIPGSETIREFLRQAGGPSTPEEIGIDRELLVASFQNAHHLRNRYTLLKLANETGLLQVLL